MHQNILKIIFRINVMFFLFWGINTTAEIKITRRKQQQSSIKKQNTGNPFNPLGNHGNAFAIKKHEETTQVIIANALAILQQFETILDSVSNIISQKVTKMEPGQLRKTEQYLQQVNEMRNLLYDTREKIQQQKPQSIQQVRVFLSNIGSLLSIVASFAKSLDYSINNKFKKVKNFDVVNTMKRSKKQDQARFIAQYMFEVQDCISSIKQALNDFDLTKTNKFFQFAHEKIITRFYKYQLNSILWYASFVGTPASLFLWQFTGRMANNKEFTYLLDTKTLNDYSINPEEQRALPDALKIFPTIYKTEPGVAIELTDGYKKTLSRGMRFYYWLCDSLLGLPLAHFSAPDALDQQKGASYAHKKKLWHGETHKARFISTIDDGLTGYFSNYFPIISLATPMLWPMAQKTWSESIYPFISSNTTALLNKMMGGIFENRSIEGQFELMISELTLDDVIGMENEKIQLDILIEYLMDPLGFTQKHGTKIDKAFVFTGPTRTGKTHLYKAFVGSLQRKLRMHGRSLRSVRAYEFPVQIIKQVGGISIIMNFMKAMAPAVFFIDEIDLIQLQRTTDGTVLADFLTGLGNVLNDDPSRPVILFCATNKIENLDRALRTKGRLGEEIRFDYPSYSHRKEFLSRILKKLGLDRRNMKIDELVQQLSEQAYETINYILNSALMRASVAGVPFAQEHFEEAIDRSIRGIMNASRKDLVQEEQLILAAHFAGHIAAFLLLELHEILHKVTIQAVTPQIKEESIYADLYQKEEQKQKKIVFGAIFVSPNGDSDKLATKETRIKTIKRLLSGYVAEELLLGSCGYTCHSEYKDEAYNIALSILLSGVKFESLPDTLKAEFAKRAVELLDQYTEEMRALLKNQTTLLRYMSDALLQHETVSNKQILELYEKFKKTQEKTTQNEVIK